MSRITLTLTALLTLTACGAPLPPGLDDTETGAPSTGDGEGDPTGADSTGSDDDDDLIEAETGPCGDGDGDLEPPPVDMGGESLDPLCCNVPGEPTCYESGAAWVCVEPDYPGQACTFTAEPDCNQPFAGVPWTCCDSAP